MKLNKIISERRFFRKNNIIGREFIPSKELHLNLGSFHRLHLGFMADSINLTKAIVINYGTIQSFQRLYFSIHFLRANIK